jgi:histidine triad (HIT) family protein
MRILETEHLLAFLDHRPLFRGHTLLVPKRHWRLLSDLPADLAAEFLTTAQRLERAIEDGLGVSGSMILVNNVVSQSVPHLHLHVIPREFKDGLRFWLGPRHPYNDENPAQAYADKIRGALYLVGGYKPTPHTPHLSAASVRTSGCAGRVPGNRWDPARLAGSLEAALACSLRLAEPR